MTTKIAHIALALEDDLHVKITLQNPGLVYQVPATQAWALLVEYNTLFDMELESIFQTPGFDEMIRNAMGPFDKAFPGMKMDLSDANEITIGFIDGDTGAYAFGHGKSAITAIADFLRSQGFVSTLTSNAKLSMYDWLDEYHYGRQRKSNDLLELELESITSPGKGAW